MDPIEFQRKWIVNTLKERSASQSHFNDLCAVLGQPTPTDADPTGDPRVVAIGEAAARLDEQRRTWLGPEGATEAELKKRTLTNLYNARPQWLRNAHGALNRAVWDAYGWDAPDPATVEEDTILARLLALNLERAGAAS